MTSIVDSSPISNWAEALVRKGLNAAVVLVVDDETPRDWDEDAGFVILRLINYAGTWGGMSNPDANADLTYQATCVALTKAQARAHADTVYRTVLARHPNGSFQVNEEGPAPFVIADREPHTGPFFVDPGPERPGLVSFVCRFTFRVVGD